MEAAKLAKQRAEQNSTKKAEEQAKSKEKEIKQLNFKDFQKAEFIFIKLFDFLQNAKATVELRSTGSPKIRTNGTKFPYRLVKEKINSENSRFLTKLFFMLLKKQLKSEFFAICKKKWFS